MGKTRLLVIGAGGHGRSVAEAANLSGLFAVVGFLDDSMPAGEMALGLPVLGTVASLAKHRNVCDQAIVAIGSNSVQDNLSPQLAEAGISLATVVHPRAFVSPSGVVGHGTAIMASAIVGTEARLGVGAIVNCATVVDHHATVRDFGHLGVNASTSGGSVLGRGAWMGAGSALGYGVKIAPGETARPCEGRTVMSHQESLEAT
jgi:sugar O-acyltransferase (sialic acid O-acetyltransferase NeuD family)